MALPRHHYIEVGEEGKRCDGGVRKTGTPSDTDH